MSGKLVIGFDSDMPEALVEVVSPDSGATSGAGCETVARLWLGPNQKGKPVDVPSEWSFLRVHLPSGRVVTLRDPGNMNRTIRRSDVEPATPAASATRVVERLGDVAAFHRDRLHLAGPLKPKSFHPGPADGGLEGVRPTDTLPDGTKVELFAPTGPVARIKPVLEGEVRFEPTDSRERGCELRLTGPGGRLVVQLPGILYDVYARADKTTDGKGLVSVRVATASRPADQLLTYLAGGNLDLAEGMDAWADQAREMVQEKMDDPFAAMVGAYLFLRTHQLDRLGSWVQNLATYFPAIPDGKVLRAWQLIHAGNEASEGEIRLLLHAAAGAGLPIYREGLNLLRDGLLLLGEPKDREAAEGLNRRAGVVLVDSPFTAGVYDRPSDESAPPTRFHVACIGADAAGG